MTAEEARELREIWGDIHGIYYICQDPHKHNEDKLMRVTLKSKIALEQLSKFLERKENEAPN